MRTNGNQGNSWSGYAAISANGRFTTFTSEATNLVQGDTNGYQDVFIHDRRTGTTTRISVNSRDREGNADSSYSSVSADGRFVAFSSSASDLVKGDTNGYTDLFVHDRETGSTRLVSVSSTGQQADDNTTYVGPGMISTDGRFIAFDSTATNLVPHDGNGVGDIFVRDRVAGTTKRVSLRSGGDGANGPSRNPTISAEGGFVSFTSDATNLVGGDTNGYADVFVRDRGAGTTRRVSVSSAGEEGGQPSGYSSISRDGRYVAFDSYATNLVGGDTNGYADVFVRDRKLGKTRRVSLSSAGAQGDLPSDYPFISADGRFVVFQSQATNLVGGDTNGAYDVFVRGPLS